MLFIEKKQVQEFLDKLKKDFEVFDCRSTLESEKLSFKKYFFPPVEEIFTTDKLGEKIHLSAGHTSKKFLLYGLSLQDLEALTQLDEIMATPSEDTFYFNNRKKSFVIGAIDENVDVASGGDIVFNSISDHEYEVLVATAKGQNFVKHYNGFFKEKIAGSKAPQIPENSSLSEWSQSMRDLLLDSELLSDAVEWSHDHKIWDELAGTCIGCGVCTYVCPICHCFSTEDKVGLDDKCSRCRKWDACTLPGFSEIAGNHNFRPTIKERYYNWFYHKFVRAYHEFGKSQCVGCGRCHKLCPAGIDIYEVLKTILEDYKKNNG